MPIEERYYFGQGQVFIREKTKTNDQPWRWLGDVSSLVLSAEGEEVLKHKEHYSGQRKVVRSIRFGGEQTLSATLYQIDNHNLAMAARGTITDIPAATITGEVLGTVKVGAVFLLQSGYNESDLVITDDGAVELTADHYDFDARTGIITFIDLPTTAGTAALMALAAAATAAAAAQAASGGSSFLKSVAGVAGGFANGGFTGVGGKFEVADIVHKGEYVMPQEFVNQPGARALLETLHANGMASLAKFRGYANGGLVVGVGVPTYKPAETSITAGNTTVDNNMSLYFRGCSRLGF